ncbi:hypothetical protein Ahy_B03g062448 [Arachis hypogaea]|uniref:Pentatricopeptide repeat-containing protein n=1 Tax=Arachis hypogaea TaxID=3818 RepID=A0A444ZU67_ARAHY|nr:hypothetical protein Ahy_B03g062448 [Arachis hypogaea]
MARCIFDKIEANNMVSWTAIIMGCAMRGHALDAVSLFEQMLMDGVEPDYVAFMAVLTACSHAGLVDEAWKYLNSTERVWYYSWHGPLCCCGRLAWQSWKIGGSL